MVTPLPPPHPPRPEARQWWQHPLLVGAFLFVFPPVGIALAWLTRWWKPAKIMATIFSGLWFLALALTPPAEPPSNETAQAGSGLASPAQAEPTAADAQPIDHTGDNLADAQRRAERADFTVASHDASDGDEQQFTPSDWRVCFQTPQKGQPVAADHTLRLGVVRKDVPCPASDGKPIPYPKMPDAVGVDYAAATERAEDAGIDRTEAHSSYADVGDPSDPGEWEVCFQLPTAGSELKHADNITAHFSVVRPGTDCPSEEGTELHPVPVPAAPKTDESSSGSSGTVGGGGSGGDPSPEDGTMGGPSEGSTGNSGNSSSSSSADTVHPGSFCTPAGNTGVTTAGTPMICGTASDGRLRWKSAG